MTYADYVIALSQKRSTERGINPSVTATSNLSSTVGGSSTSVNPDASSNTSNNTRGATNKSGVSISNSPSVRTEAVPNQGSVSLNVYEKIWHY